MAQTRKQRYEANLKWYGSAEDRRTYNREYARKIRASWTPDEKQEFNAKIRDWRHSQPPEWRQKHREDCLARKRETKRLVFEKYGGAICCWCKETDFNVLCLDHIDNNGAEHRKRMGIAGGSGTGTYYWCKKNGYPPVFQVLCASCNQAKQLCGGILPQNRKDLYKINWKAKYKESVRQQLLDSAM